MSTVLLPDMSGPVPWAASMKFQVTQVPAVIGAHTLVSYNANRYYLGVGAPAASSPFQIQPGFVIGTGQGIAMTTNIPFREFFFSYHGIIVQTDWQYFTSGSGWNITVIEGIWVP